MSLQHFFLKDQIIARQGSEVFPLALEGDDLAHARALRLGAGEHIAVVDADGDYFECEIVSCAPSSMTVRIAHHLERIPERPRILLVQGMAKGEKMDGIIRHATEIGVDCFLPLCARRSVMRLSPEKAARRVARWRSVAKSAAMQSGRSELPCVMDPVGVFDACRRLAECACVIICWEECSRGGIADALAAISLTDDAEIAVVVGPEGGLEADEIEALMDSNARAETVTLGPTVLRTETAGLIAPAIVLHELGALS